MHGLLQLRVPRGGDSRTRKGGACHHIRLWTDLGPNCHRWRVHTITGFAARVVNLLKCLGFWPTGTAHPRGGNNFRDVEPLCGVCRHKNV